MIMKKIYSIIASAIIAVGFTACTQSDFVETSAPDVSATSIDNAIQFGTYMGKLGTTRATGGVVGNITTTSLKTGSHNAGFGVIAYHTNTDDWAGASNAVIPNFMWNQQVAWNTTNSVWSYTPVKFWPNDFSTGVVDNKEGAGQNPNNAYGSQNGGKVSFFAYAPWVDFPATTANSVHGKDNVSQHATPKTDGIVALTANDATKEPEVYYILNNADLNNAVDLLWGLRGNSSGYNMATNTTDATSVGDYNVNLTKQSVSEEVNFLFKHALAKLGGHTATGDPAGVTTGLQVVLDVDDGSLSGGVKTGTAIFGGTKQANTLVTVKSIEIYDLKTAKDNSLPGVTETKSDLVKEGWFNLATGTWTATALGAASGATYSSKVGTGAGDVGTLNADIAETPASLAWSSTKWTYTGADDTEPGVTTTPKDVYTNASAVPALVLIPSNTAQTLVVRVQYVVRTYDANLNNAASGSEGTWTKVTQTITSKVTIPANALKANTYYKLLLHLGLTSVKFTASVCDWEDAANGGTNGNENDDNNNDKDVYLPSNTLQTTSVASTETVSSASVAAGTYKTYSAPAATGDFTINLTGIDDNTSALAVTVSGATTEQKAGSPSYTAGESTGTVTVTLPTNTLTGETQTTTVTIISTDASPAQTTTVTIVQVAP